jgi:sugar-phosphatase
MSEILLVDMDGTLIDTNEAQRRSWTLWAAKNNVDPWPFLTAYGRTAREKIAELAPFLDVAREAEAIARLEQAETAGIVPLPGANRLWRSDQRFAVVTSADRTLAHVRLKAAGLPAERPETIVTADDVRRGKPDPEPYLLAAARLSADPADCTAIEDAPAGVQAGLAAGMRVVALTTTTGSAEIGLAHVVTANLEEFLVGDREMVGR